MYFVTYFDHGFLFGLPVEINNPVPTS